MNKGLALLAAIVAAFVLASLAQAMPVSALKAATKNSNQTTLVAQWLPPVQIPGPARALPLLTTEWGAGPDFSAPSFFIVGL